MKRLDRFSSHYVVIANEDIDTDQIIPARFLTATTREGIGDGLFADWRYDEDGVARPEFVLNQATAEGAGVLVVGRNFGCGSSREHAAWALEQNGFRVVVGTEIADIFRVNALKNGVLPVVVPLAVHRCLVAAETGRVQIDVGAQHMTLDDGTVVHFEIDPFAKHCLIEGVDELGFLLQQEKYICDFERDIEQGVLASAGEVEE